MKTLANRHPLFKFSIALIASGVALLISMTYEILPHTRIMLCWDAFVLCYLILSWITFSFVDTNGITKSAKNQDKSHTIIFIILFSATIFSVYIILSLLKSNDELKTDKGLVESISFLGIFFSWMLFHTIYSFRYAHLYYSREKGINGKKPGLNFLGDKDPDYMDFAYFSFVIGMTFQVSDVSINSQEIRKIVLIHSLLSFIFNVVIIALCVNAVVNI